MEMRSKLMEGKKRWFLLLVIIPLIVLITNATLIGAEEDVEKTPASQESFSSLEASSDPVNVALSPPDVAKFPTVKVYALVTDENGDPITGLDASDFTLTEKAEDESSPTEEKISVSTVSQTGKVAVALGIDRSGSMGWGSGKLDDAKDAANEFVNNLANLDRAAVISFASSPRVDQDFTSDKTDLHNAINSLSSGGGTAVYDTVYKSVQEVSGEIGVKAVVVFTDGKTGSDSHSINEAISLAKNKGVPVYTIGIGGGPNESKLKKIANETGGFYTYAPSASDLEQIYQDITQAIKDQYLLTYKTHNTNFDGTKRAIEVEATQAGNSDVDTTTYTVTRPPEISLTQHTKDLLAKAQYADQSLTIKAKITDDKGVSVAKLFYRTSGSGSSYTEVRMNSSSGTSVYSAIIPKSEVVTPGVDFYLTASDGTLTTSSPLNNPSQYPHQISILPNKAPIIDHTPVTSAPANSSIEISAAVTDSTDRVNSVKLYYRESGYVGYEKVDMQPVSGSDTYKGEIPKNKVTTAGVEYYIMAADNHTVRSYHGSDTKPHVISVGVSAVNFEPVVPGESSETTKVMKGGTFYRWYKMKDSSGNPITDATITLSRYGKKETVTPDKNGLVGLYGYADEVASGSTTDPQAKSIDLIQKIVRNGAKFPTDELRVRVNVEPRKFAEEWDITWTTKVGAGAGGYLGPVEFASASLSTEKNTTMRFKLKQNSSGKNVLELSRDLGRDVTGEVSLGPRVQAGVVDAGASISAGVGIGGFGGQTLEVKDPFSDTEAVLKPQTAFIIDTFFTFDAFKLPGALPLMRAMWSMYSDSVVGNHLVESRAGMALSGKVGSEASVSLNEGSSSLGIGVDLMKGKFNIKSSVAELLSNGGKRLAVEVSTGLDVADFKATLGGFSTGGSPFSSDELTSEISMKTKSDGGINSLGIQLTDQTMDKKDLFSGTIEQNTYDLQFDTTYIIDEKSNLPQNFQKLVENRNKGWLGTLSVDAASLTKDFNTSINDKILTTGGKLNYRNTEGEFKHMGLEFEQGFGLGLGFKIKLGANLDYLNTNKYLKQVNSWEKSMSKNLLSGSTAGLTYKKYPKDSHLKWDQSGEGIMAILKNTIQGLTPIADDVFEIVEEKIKAAGKTVADTLEKVKEGGAKLVADSAKAAKDGIHNIAMSTFETASSWTSWSLRQDIRHNRVGLSQNVGSARQQAIIRLNKEFSKSAQTVGKATIVNTLDKNGNKVKSFSPMQFTTFYTDNQLRKSSLTSVEKKLEVFRWNYDREVWETVGGSSNPQKNKVTAQITQTGIYIAGYSGPVEVSTTLEKGWNLVSFPGKPENPDPEEAFADDIDPLYMYRWDPATGQYTGGYISASDLELKAGASYWIYAWDGNTEIDLEVTIPQDSSINLPGKGWHMVGSPYSIKWGEVKVDGTKVKNETSGSSYGGPLKPYIFGYDEGNREYHLAEPGNWTDLSLGKWKGYWVETTDSDGELSFDKGDSISTSASTLESDNQDILVKAASKVISVPPAPPVVPSKVEGLQAVVAPTLVRGSEGVTFTVKSDQPVESLRAEVLNSNGQSIWVGQDSDSKLNWDAKGIANGIYLYTVSAKIDGEFTQAGAGKLLVLK